MTVPASSPWAASRTSSAGRTRGAMMNWSAASTSSRAQARTPSVASSAGSACAIRRSRRSSSSRIACAASTSRSPAHSSVDAVNTASRAGRDVELDRSEAPQRAQPVVAAGALGPVGDVEQRVVVAPAGRRVRPSRAAAAAAAVVAGDHLEAARPARRRWPPPRCAPRGTARAPGRRAPRGPAATAPASARGGRAARRRPAGTTTRTVFCRWVTTMRFSSTSPSRSKVQTGRPFSSATSTSASGSTSLSAAFETGQRDRRAVGGHQRLREVVQHHHAAEGRGQRRHQQAVKAAGRHAGHRPGGVAAEAVRQQPFARDAAPRRPRRAASRSGAAAPPRSCRSRLVLQHAPGRARWRRGRANASPRRSRPARCRCRRSADPRWTRPCASAARPAGRAAARPPTRGGGRAPG